MMINGICANCNKEFSRYSYRKTVNTFCSINCYNEWRERHAKTLMCKQCGKEFAEYKGRGRVFCSQSCFLKWRKEHNRQKLGECKLCGKQFYYYPSHEGFFCSRECLYKWMRKGITRKCKVCGKDFYWLPSTKQTYCSQECYWTAKTGMRRESRSVVKICLNCKVEFKIAFCRSRAKFCSVNCKRDFYRKKLEVVTCETCGKEFYCRRTKRKPPRFCSMKCRRISLSGGLTLYYDSKSAKQYLKKIYGGDKCLICGWDKTPNEVCHIIPAKVGGQTKLENLVLLCPNHHQMYDRGLIPLERLLAVAKKTTSCALKGT
jgi:endogenous inhibitor of DNA gyrase (YacG/DUF329 family)